MMTVFPKKILSVNIFYVQLWQTFIRLTFPHERFSSQKILILNFQHCDICSTYRKLVLLALFWPSSFHWNRLFPLKQSWFCNMPSMAQENAVAIKYKTKCEANIWHQSPLIMLLFIPQLQLLEDLGLFLTFLLHQRECSTVFSANNCLNTNISIISQGNKASNCNPLGMWVWLHSE